MPYVVVTGMTTNAEAPKRSTMAPLSGEVSNLLIELGSAIPEFELYPRGHPARILPLSSA